MLHTQCIIICTYPWGNLNNIVEEFKLAGLAISVSIQCKCLRIIIFSQLYLITD